MPKLKPEEVQHRRQEIIDAARACFLRNGFHQTTTDEICHEASITPGGLYHYFGSKEEIISAVIEDAAASVVAILRERTEVPDVRSAFRQVGAFFFEAMRDPNMENVARFEIETWAETLRNEKLADSYQRAWALRRQWLANLIARAQQDGIYNDNVDPKGFADLMIAILVGLRVGRLMWGDDFELEGAMTSLFLMHAGRITNGEGLELPPEMRTKKATGSS